MKTKIDLQKLVHEKGAGDNTCTYPFTQEMLDNLKPCRLANPCVGKSHGTKVPDDFDIEAAMWEVVDVRMKVQQGIFPYEFMQKYYPYKKEFGDFPMEITPPLLEEGLSFDDPAGLANVVHMDLPSQMPNACLRWLLGQGADVKGFEGGYVNFLESVPFMEEQISDGTKRELKKVFEAKYFHGLPRPEVVYEAVTGFDGKLITAYEEGCPTHPAFPQGHGAAAAGGVNALIMGFNENHYQLKVLLDTVYIWLQARVLAGVHYKVDGIASLVMSPLKKYLRKDIVEKYTI